MLVHNAPKIPTPLHGEKTSAAEATLNWQTENAIAQNTTLQRIDSKVTQMGAKLTQVEVKVDGNTKIANEVIVLIHKRLQQVEKQTTPPGQDLFYYLELKEKEIQTLKEQIRMLEETGQVPQPLEEEEFFQSLRRGPPPKPQPSIFASLHTENPLTSFLKEYRDTIIPKIVAINQDSEEEEQSSDYDSSESSQASSDDMIMVTTSNQPEVKTEDPDDTEPMDTTTPASTTFSANGVKYIFTLDDITVSKWAQRFKEFHSWMETQKLTRESNYEILTEFVSRFKGVLRDWWSTIPPGDQMQFLVQQDFAAVIRAMHTHFLGNPDDVKTLQRKEFFKRKCCSFERKDLEKHFNSMIKLFFTLGADQSLKQVILASIPELLQNAVDRNLQQRRRNILQLTVGEIQQETFIALEELCDRKRIIKEYMSGSKELDKACKIPELTIKYKKEHQCHCRSRGKKTFSRRYKREPSKIPNFPVFPRR
ncbi:hypothetical protein V6N12_069923 [Hibiscus sabdariffa]|uniref:Retrotransposon gag domain-containing protein n=1 Tax=Hibiscus sabdariffa TaxID=183260 RepID=A0ABR2FFU6_9ROSI